MISKLLLQIFGFSRKLLKQKFIHNFASLLGTQLVINVSSLVLIPLLSRKLGSELWGIYIISQSFTAFTSIIIDFGLDYTATRFVSQNKDNKNSLSEISTAILAIKLTCTILVIALSCTLYFLYQPIQNHPEYFFLGISIGLMSGFSPWWYFQGIEKMIFPALLSISLYISYSVIAFFIVDGPEDGWKVLFLYALMTGLIDIFLYNMMYKKIDFLIPKYSFVKTIAQESSRLFIAKFSEGIYSSVNTIVLGLYVTPTQVSYYGNSDKVLKLPRIAINNLVRALYPNISSMSKDQPSKARRMKLKIVVWVCSISLIGSLIIFMLSDQLIILIFGSTYLHGVYILNIIIWTIPLFAFNKTMSVLGLAAFNKDGAFLRITVISTIINFLLLVLFLEILGLVGIAVSFLLSELSKSIILFFNNKQ